MTAIVFDFEDINRRMNRKERASIELSPSAYNDLFREIMASWCPQQPWELPDLRGRTKYIAPDTDPA